jgi:glucose-6-phosphate 1-dehydrogenase
MDATVKPTARSDSGTAPAPDCTLVIFGAGGDLTKRLLMPALYNLAGSRLLSDCMTILGVDRAANADAGWAAALTGAMESFTHDPTAEFHAERIDPRAWGWVRSRLRYLQADFLDPAAYARLGGLLQGNVVFYLAVAARFFGPIVSQLGAAGLLREGPGAFRRVVIEKPFGSDLPSAQRLNREILAQAGEQQVYRIDHFLGKETVQSILAIRFANALFEPFWDRDHIDHVQITAAETIGVEQRGAFYEPTGALRDMVPNHMFQLLCMAAMEPPDSLMAEAVRTAKARLAEAVRPIRPEDAVRGQYAAGRLLGEHVAAYGAEPHVAPDSRTETYVALRLDIETPRWAGVPFYLRTGKHLTARRTEIALQFKPRAHGLFRAAASAASRDVMVLQIDPEQGAETRFNVKVPGPEMRLGRATMRFRYGDVFAERPNVGYETLLYDCMVGDATLFQRADNIEAGWAAVQPLLDAWRTGEPEPYASGTDGPAGADALLAQDSRLWRPLAEDA